MIEFTSSEQVGYFIMELKKAIKSKLKDISVNNKEVFLLPPCLVKFLKYFK